MRHLLTLADLTPAEIERIFAITEDLKTKYRAGPARAAPARPRDGAAVRKAVAADAGELRGGHGPPGRQQLLLGDDVGFGKRESMADFARVLSEMVDVIVVRAEAARRRSSKFAEHCDLLGDQRPDRPVASLPGAGRSVHAARALSASSTGSKLAWVGDGNNVARSLADGCGKLGVQFVDGHARRATSFDDEFRRPSSSSDVPELELADRPTIRSRRCAARRPSTPTSGPAWARKPRRSKRQARLRRLPGQRQADGARRRRTPSSCTACRPTAAKK